MDGDPRLLRSLEAFMAMEFNCIQAVLLPYIENYPDKVQDLILDMTIDLGGGVADLGYVCGGLLGGVMAISRSLTERGYAPEKRQQKIDKFVQDFSARHNSPFCSGITGRDRDTEKAYETCRILIVEAIQAVDETIGSAED